MNAILVDYTKLDSHNFLKQQLKQPPKQLKNFSIGLVIVLQKNIMDDLREANSKVDLNFLNTEEFCRGITSHCYILCNYKKKLCVLNSECYKLIENVLYSLFTGFPSDAMVWVKIPITELNFSEILDKFISCGFCHPYMTDAIPLTAEANSTFGVALLRKNIQNTSNKPTKTLHKVLYVMQQYKEQKESCSLYAKFSKNAIQFLKQACHTGSKSEGDSQKELTGELQVKNVVKQNRNTFVYVIDVDKTSVNSGENESVNVSSTRYNFHSHPKDAYIRHSVEKAWPSATDYLGCRKLGANTIFHCVTTLEGLYVISLSPFWGKKIQETDEKFILKNYNINHKENLTPVAYVEKVNSILYKKHPIYKVLYLPWKKADAVFHVSFPHTDKSCLVTQEIYENYIKLHKIK